jgi:hypothetical protein
MNHFQKFLTATFTLLILLALSLFFLCCFNMDTKLFQLSSFPITLNYSVQADLLRCLPKTYERRSCIPKLNEKTILTRVMQYYMIN